MQVLVIGAGVVGLAIARQAALAGHEVIVAESTGGIGNGVSSRNSEVIHAGMYYPTGSQRAKHCVQGRRLLYDFCASHGVPHRKVGKLIVAVDEKQQAKIEGIAKQGEINGVEGLEFLGGNAARAMEPALNCTAALLSSETGIIDSHAFMLALQGDFEDRGGMIAFNTPVEGLKQTPDGWEVRFGGADAVGKAVNHDVAARIDAEFPGTGALRVSRIGNVQREVVGTFRIPAIDDVVALGSLAVALPGLGA